MKLDKCCLIACLLPLLSIESRLPAATPVSSAFTYQGQLKQNGAPITGSVNLAFTLWDADGTLPPPASGKKIGGTQILNGVQVSNGLFTVTLNAGGEFGASAFNGEARWLGIEVGGTTLGQRQPLRGVPYAMYALNGPGPGGSGPWATSGANIYNTNTGNVGIGVISPGMSLEVTRPSYYGAPALGAADGASYAYLHVTDNFEHSLIWNRPKAMRFGTETSRGIGYVEHMRIDANGNVGVGSTPLPWTRLKVEGPDIDDGVAISARIGSLATSHTGAIAIFGTTNSPNGVGVGGFDGSDDYSGLAGYFIGKVKVTGNLEKPAGSFKIDHPLNPGDKYLSHSFVESPDMKNIYDGIVTTDASGEAMVTLPDWFEALNKDFRYQLTVIGQFAQAIVSSKVSGNRFRIKTDKPNVEVSWQVTGIRKDAYAEAHRIIVEEDKPEKERGRYLHPELYGYAQEFSVDADRLKAVRSMTTRP